jgi:hypothetical protein
MSWEILLLGGLILTIATIAFIAMRKIKATEFSSFKNGSSIDQDELTQKIVQAISTEMHTIFLELKEELKKISIPQQPIYGYSDDATKTTDNISMDESIIPTTIIAKTDLSNLENMAKENKQVDKDLEKSKSKLANLMEKKRRK